MITIFKKKLDYIILKVHTNGVTFRTSCKKSCMHCSSSKASSWIPYKVEPYFLNLNLERTMVRLKSSTPERTLTATESWYYWQQQYQGYAYLGKRSTTLTLRVTIDLFELHAQKSLVGFQNTWTSPHSLLSLIQLWLKFQKYSPFWKYWVSKKL